MWSRLLDRWVTLHMCMLPHLSGVPHLHINRPLKRPLFHLHKSVLCLLITRQSLDDKSEIIYHFSPPPPTPTFFSYLYKNFFFCSRLPSRSIFPFINCEYILYILFVGGRYFLQKRSNCSYKKTFLYEEAIMTEEKCCLYWGTLLPYTVVILYCRRCSLYSLITCRINIIFCSVFALV